MKFLVAICFLAFFQTGFSQTKQKPKEKSCRLIFLQRPKDAPEFAYLFDGEKSRKVTLSGMNFSELLTVPGGDLTLGMTPNEILLPENFPSDAPKVKIPSKTTDFYLLVTEDPKNQIFPIRLTLLDLGAEKVKTGQTLWLNLTGHRIEGRLGEESLKIPPMGRVLGKAPLDASGYYKAQFAYIPKGESRLQPIMKKTWWYDSSSRNLGFVIDSGGRLPRVFTFRDDRIANEDEDTEEGKEGIDPP